MEILHGPGIRSKNPKPIAVFGLLFMDARRYTKHASLGYLACFSVLGVIIPLLAFVATGGHLSFAMAIGTSVIVYSGFRLSYLSFYSPRSILQLTFWMFVYCWLGLAASAQLKANHFPWPTVTNDDDFLWTEAVIVLGLVAYEAGVHFSGKGSGERPAIFTLGYPSRGRYVALTLACMGISSWAIYKRGGAPEVLRTRYEIQRTFKRSGMAQSDLLTYTALQRVPPAVALLVSVCLFTDKLAFRRKRRFVTVGLTAIVLFNLVANYPPSLPRLYLGFIVVSVAALVLRNRAKAVPFFVLSMVLGLIVLFPYSDYFRTKAGYSTSDLASPTQKLIEKPDYDAFQMIANTVKVVGERGVAFGYNFVGAALFYVPRVLWPEKPRGTGWTVGQVVGYSSINLNLSSPLWAEFYYGGGISLVIVGFWIYGYVTRLAERKKFRAPISAVVIAYGAGAQIFFLRGDLLNSVAYFAPGVLLLLMFIGKPVWSRSAVGRTPHVARSRMTRWQPRFALEKD